MSEKNQQQVGCCLWRVWVCKSFNGFVGLVVRVSASSAVDLGFNSCLCIRKFSRSSDTSDLKIGTPVAALPGAWRCRISAGTDWPGVSIL